MTVCLHVDKSQINFFFRSNTQNVSLYLSTHIQFDASFVDWTTASGFVLTHSDWQAWQIRYEIHRNSFWSLSYPSIECARTIHHRCIRTYYSTFWTTNDIYWTDKPRQIDATQYGSICSNRRKNNGNITNNRNKRYIRNVILSHHTDTMNNRCYGRCLWFPKCVELLPSVGHNFERSTWIPPKTMWIDIRWDQRLRDT